MHTPHMNCHCLPTHLLEFLPVSLRLSPDPYLQVHPDLSRQLLQDGYRLDEIPDDEDLDLIPPKAMGPSGCCCSEVSSCSMQ